MFPVDCRNCGHTHFFFSPPPAKVKCERCGNHFRTDKSGGKPASGDASAPTHTPRSSAPMFAAPYESASPGERSPYLGVNEDEHLMHFLGAFLGGVMAGGLAALVHWGMEMYLAWAPGSPMFFSGIRATTITVSFVGAVVGALAALLFAGIERGGEGYHIKGSTYGSLIGALAGLLATYFDWSPDAVAQLRGFNWASLAEKFWGEGHVSPFWIRILGGACSGAAIMLIGIVVGVAGSWGDAAFSWLSRIVRLAIAWSIVGFLLWRMLVMIGP